MPIWVYDVLHFFGLTKDSKRPNLGALLVLVGVGFFAMGYSPGDLEGWSSKAEYFASEALKFATKLDNILGAGLASLGYAMTRGKGNGDLTDEELKMLRAQIEAWKARARVAPAVVVQPPG